jgi:hypothetical protein
MDFGPSVGEWFDVTRGKALWRALAARLGEFEIPDSGFEIRGFQTPDSEFRIPDSGFRIPDSRLRIPDCGFQVANIRFQSMDSRLPCPNSRFQSTHSGYGIRDSRSRNRRWLENRESGMSNLQWIISQMRARGQGSYGERHYPTLAAPSMSNPSPGSRAAPVRGLPSAPGRRGSRGWVRRRRRGRRR